MVLSLDNDNNADERRKPDHPSGSKAGGRKAAKAKGKNPEVGQALRTIYQNTIDEDVPSEMLDLLGKLG